LKRYAIRVVPGAERDIGAAFFWYRERNAAVANAFRIELFDAIDRLVERALLNSADAEGNRKAVLHRFPYSVVYEVQNRTVTILAVAHHRRRPDYWRAGKR
jgi:plasmid stabilization system protein ParE